MHPLHRSARLVSGIALLLSLMANTLFAQAADFALLRRLAADDPKVAEQAELELEDLELDEEAHVRLLRRGFHSEDLRVATWCAQRLSYDNLTGKECSRAIDLIWAEMLRTGDEGEQGQLCYLWSSDDLARYLPMFERFAEAGGTLDAISGGAHRMLRSEHLPLVCDLLLSKRHDVVETMSGYLGLMIERTDARRERVAEVLLRRRVLARAKGPGESRVLPLQPLPRLDERPGYPPLLRACLHRFFVSDSEDLATPSGFGVVECWLRRWWMDSTPGPSDRKLLLSLLGREIGGVPGHALRQLQLLGDASVRTEIERFVEQRPKHLESFDALPMAHAALASFGNAKSKEWLRFDALRELSSLRLLLELDPSAGRGAVAAWFEAPGDGGLFGFDEDSCERAGLRIDKEAQLSFLEDWLRAGLLSLPAALHVLDSLLAVRSKAAVRAVAAHPAWTNGELPELYEPWFLNFCALLECLSTEELLDFLRGIREPARVPGLGTVLLRCGARDFRGLTEILFDEEGDARVDLVELAERGFTKDPRILERVREIAADEERGSERRDALRSLLISGGVSSRVVRALHWGSRARDQDTDRELTALVLSGRSDAFLKRLLQGDVDLGISVDRLRRLVADGEDREKRIRTLLADPEQFLWYDSLTIELALLGHEPAMSEVLEQYRIGRHYWIDNRSGWEYYPNRDPALTELWISELASNCCRAVSARQALMLCCGVRSIEYTNLLPSNHQIARRWWRFAKGRLRYSETLQRFVVAPR